MSEYTDTTYTFSSDANQREVAERAGLGASATASYVGTVAGLFQQFERRLQGLESAVSNEPSTSFDVTAQRSKALEIQIEALRTYPVLASATRLEGGCAVEEIQATLSGSTTSRSADTNVVKDLPAAQRIFTQALTAGYHRLLRAESAVLRDKVHRSLAELGYQIQTPRRPLQGAVAVRGAKRGGTAISVKFTPQSGHLQLDLSGYDGLACEEEKRRFLGAMTRHGITLQTVATTRHGRIEGGALAQEVAALVDDTSAASMKEKPLSGPQQSRRKTR